MKGRSTVLALILGVATPCATHAMGGANAVTIIGVMKMLPNGGRPETKAAFPAIADWSSLKIRLERWGCYGNCPVYKVEIGGDGTVVYDGTDGVTVEGKHRARISAQAVRTLFAEFQKAEFFWLFDEYRPVVNDAPSYVVAISFDGHAKTVFETMGLAIGMPEIVKTLENRVDDVAGTKIWVEGDADTAASLKAEGWDFRVKSEKVSALLVNAARMGNFVMVRQLLDDGVSARDHFGCSALAFAADGSDVKTARMLVAAGAPAVAPEYESGHRYYPYCRPLSVAAGSGVPQIVELVLSLHPDVNARDFKGRTALMDAAENSTTSPQPDRDFARAVRMLIAAGADVDARDDEGRSALMLAEEDPETVRALLEAGAADVNSADRFGQTPLMKSIDPGVTEVLLAAGADPYLKDKDGKTALDLVENWRKTGPALQRWMAKHPQK